MNLYKQIKNDFLKESVSSGREEMNSNLIPYINATVYGNEALYDYDYTNEELDEAIMTTYEPLMREALKEVLPSADIKCTSVYHPKYYNYEGDSVNFDLTFNVDEFNALEQKVIYDNPYIDDVLHDKFKSYSGFHSFMADNLEDYEQQEDFRKVATVFIIAGRRFIEDVELQHGYDEKFMEYVYSNFKLDPESELYEESEDNRFKATKHVGFGDYNDDDVPVYNNQIDHTGDFSNAKLDKLTNDELNRAFDMQKKKLAEVNAEKLGDQRTRNGRMNKIFNTSNKLKYSAGVERIKKELEKRNQKIDLNEDEQDYANYLRDNKIQDLSQYDKNVIQKDDLIKRYMNNPDDSTLDQIIRLNAQTANRSNNEKNYANYLRQLDQDAKKQLNQLDGGDR
jgi:hypothetical protein